MKLSEMKLHGAEMLMVGGVVAEEVTACFISGAAGGGFEAGAIMLGVGLGVIPALISKNKASICLRTGLVVGMIGLAGVFSNKHQFHGPEANPSAKVQRMPGLEARQH